MCQSDLESRSTNYQSKIRLPQPGSEGFLDGSQHPRQRLQVASQTLRVRNFGPVAATVYTGSGLDKFEFAGSKLLCVNSWKQRGSSSCWKHMNYLSVADTCVPQCRKTNLSPGFPRAKNTLRCCDLGGFGPSVYQVYVLSTSSAPDTKLSSRLSDT